MEEQSIERYKISMQQYGILVVVKQKAVSE